MKLIEDWKSVLKLSWSVRLALLSTVFSAAEVGVQLFRGSVPPLWFAVVASALGIAAAVARVVYQASMNQPNAESLQ